MAKQVDGYPFFTFMKKRIINRDDGKPYMIRWELLRVGKFFSIKLHKIVASDDVCLHDHPWPFISFILKGGYHEWREFKSFAALNRASIDNLERFPTGYQCSKWYGPGSVLYRPASYAHRLELKNDTPCYTLVFTGSVIRKWGFFTKTGWIYWRDYNKRSHC